MAKKIFTRRTYTLWDLAFRIPMRICPVNTVIRLVRKIVNALIPAYTVLVTASFIDTALAIFRGEATRSAIYLPLALLLIIVLHDYLLWNLMQYFDLKFKQKITLSVQEAITEKRAKLEYQHIENNDSWDLISRVCKEPENRIAFGFINQVEALDMILRICSILFVLTAQIWWVGLIVVIVSSPLFYLAVKGSKRTYQENKEAQKYTRRAEYLRGVLQGRDAVEERSLFGYTTFVNNDWQEKYETARKIDLKVRLKYLLQTRATSLVTVVLSFLIIGLLLIPLQSGALSIGMFMGLTAGTTELIIRMSWQLAWVTGQITEIREYLRDLTAFFALEETDGVLEKPADLAGFSFESITFQNVSFRYPGTERYILKNFSLRLQKGRHYAVVGINGAGKTTLTKLLTGLYDQFEGEILINGRSIRTYSQAELKSIFGVVYQDFARYYLTLRDSVALGDARTIEKDHESEVEASILSSLSAIGLNEAIQTLPNGIDTWLGKIKEGGLDLSGGEWQRVAIARILHNPAQVRILDEPTAALDPVAESEVYEMFGRISKGISTIFITHRLGAARLADEIIVLDQGAVAEMGSHDALVSQNGIYAQMYEAQRSWYQ